jgi:putative xylitol transport system permease protein
MAEIVEEPKPRRITARETAKRIFRHENAVLIIVLGALIGTFGGITKGLTLATDNMTNVLLQSAIRGVASMGQAFVILSGGIDVSVGGLGLMCSILGAAMMTRGWLNIVGHPVSIYIAMPIMVLVGGAVGAANGSAVSRIGMPPLIVTLAMWQITSGAAHHITSGASVSDLQDELAFFGSGRIAGVPVPVIFFVVIAVIAYFVLNHTTYGRSIYAVGGNPVSAWLSGIKVKNILFSVYVIAGLLAGIAAIISTARIMSASMRSLGGLEIDSIAAVTVGGISLAGGKGNVIGAIVGVLIIGVVNNAMSVMGAGPDVQDIVKGVIIFGAVAADYVRRRG